MVVYEGKAFNEKQVATIKVNEITTLPLKIKERYNIELQLTEKNNTLFWGNYLLETAISKLNELVTLINERENEILKLKYRAE